MIDANEADFSAASDELDLDINDLEEIDLTIKDDPDDIDLSLAESAPDEPLDQLPPEPSQPKSRGDKSPQMPITDPMATLVVPDPMATLVSDPMATLVIPDSKHDRSAGDARSAKTISIFEATVGNPTDPAEKPDQPAEPDPTLVLPKSEIEKTIINPEAAQEAAERFSVGLKSVISPRTISREDNPGKLQDYKVQERLGAGAFGVVFRAVQVPLERNVAVKVLHVDEDESEADTLKLKNEFLREAQFTGRLEHPNIVPIHDIGLTVTPSGKVNPFYAMKEIRGKSWLETIRTMSRGENLTVFKHVVNAIGFAHASNILHCDLKPANVMVGEYGEVLVVDWGQAIDLAQPETIRPGGTPAYISPEMASYWCDIHLNNKTTSPSRAEIGCRTDVYLLGALLFELVTGFPPHSSSNNESPYEVIRRAAKNEIVPYEAHVDDELLQIALRALRASKIKSIETVAGLQTAIQKYEARRLSIELRNRAYEILAEAKQNANYDDFQRARFSFEESLEKWQNNKLAQQGLRDAQLSCAELALKDQNFDLGIGMLDSPSTEQEKTVKAQLLEGKTKRDRRKRLVRLLALGLAASIIVGIAVNAFMINENNKSAQRRDLAVAEKQKIEEEIGPLRAEVETNQRTIEENQQIIAQFPIQLEREQEKLDVQKQKFALQLKTEQEESSRQLSQEQQNNDRELAAEKLKHEANLKSEQERLAAQLETETQKFESEKSVLQQQKSSLTTQVANLNESSKLLVYKSQLTNIAQELRAGDYRETRRLLDQFENRNHWELARLDLMAHREVESLFPEKRLITFAASADGSRFALAFEDEIEIRSTSRFQEVLASIPVKGPTAIALSNDGQALAFGRPAESPSEPGTIWIVDLSNAAAPQQTKILDAQTSLISHLEFSPDANRFLAVGVPSKIRKSSGEGLEEELMVWDENWNRIDVKLIVARGEKPKFSTASFSKDGSRILTTNPDGLARDQILHVFAQSDSYQWKTSSPASGLNAATFGNEIGSEVVACQRDEQAGTYSLVNWKLDESARSNRNNPNFINASVSTGETTIRNVAPLNQKATSIWRSGNWILTGGQDKRITLWDWETKQQTSYGGHSRDVDFCALYPSLPANSDSTESHILLSVSAGKNPEILKTDLAAFQPEVITKQMGRVSTTDLPSPTALSMSGLTRNLAIGNDMGQVSVERLDQRIQWDVSAWKNHFPTDEYLFAQSRGDNFYKFNRQTGALDSVITQLANHQKGDKKSEIVEFQVSQDGKTALVVTSDHAPEFQIWNLETESLIQTIDYGQEDVFGTGTEKELLALRLSPNGKSVVAGKVGVFAWSTETGIQIPLTQPQSEMARNPISAIEFVDEGTMFLVSWKDRIDLFELGSNAPARRFNTREISYSKNEPNVLEAQSINGQIRILARASGTSERTGGLSLIALESDETLASFPAAKFASFSQSRLGNVVLVNRTGSANALESWVASTGRTKPLSLPPTIAGKFDNRFQAPDRAFENVRGQLLIQTSTRNSRNSIQRDWNSISTNPDRSLGQLRVIAEPSIDFVATANQRVITLDHGTIRFWQLLENSVQPAGIAAGYFETCQLSPDERSLLAIDSDSKRIVGFNSMSSASLFDVEADETETFTAIAWHPDSSQFAVADGIGNVQVWNRGDSTNPATRVRTIENLTDSVISELRFAESGGSLLAITPASGEAHVVHLEGDHRIVIRPSDGQRITTGDISKDGTRIVTGSDNGRLTIWNTESSAAVTSNSSEKKLNTERELMILQNKHQSKIQIARFVEDADGSTNVVSAEASGGENQYLIWKTSR